MQQRHAGTDPVVAIIGTPLGHTLSPIIHTAAFKELELPWRYVPIDIPSGSVVALIDILKRSNFAGLNVTMPHKTEAMAAMDRVEPSAERCKAVNTIVLRDGKAAGLNTDCTGFLRALRDDASCDPAGKTATVLGAGGVSRAAIVALLDAKGAKVRVWARRLEAARALVDGLKPSFGDRLEVVDTDRMTLADAVTSADIVVNATPVGMYPHQDATPLPADWLTSDHVVADLVYRPATTRLLHDARERGALTVDGVGTFIYQAAEAFTAWTGLSAPIGVMRAALEGVLDMTTSSNRG